MKKNYLFSLLLSLSLAAVLSSCKKEYETIETIDQRKIQEYITKNNLSAAMTKDPTGFYYQVLDKGAGSPLVNKDSVLFTYSYNSLATGTTYYTIPDYSNAGNKLGYLAEPSYPTAFRTALTGLNYGAKVRIIVPSYLAFGKNGSTTYHVPSNEIIDVSLTTFLEKTQWQLDDTRIKTFLAAKGLQQSGIKDRVYYIGTPEPGTGTDEIKSTSTVKVKYTGRLLNGTQFDSSTDGTASFNLSSNIIAGWQKALPLYKKGSKFRIFIPSDLAYGPQTQTSIPANSILDFDIEIVDVTN